MLASLMIASASGSEETCLDTCSYINDGICDDGGLGAEYAVCPFGVDCSDCGIREGDLSFRSGYCVPRGSFVELDFNQATLYRSNIGGQGGRCWLQPPDADVQCDEVLNAEDAVNAGLIAGANTVHEMYIRNVGVNSLLPQYATDGNVGDGATIDLIVTNTTEYKSWDTSWNWVKQEETIATGANARGGGFVGTNLAGARTSDQPGASSGWSETFTACEFRYQFVTGEPTNRVPVTLPRTYISVYVSAPHARTRGSQSALVPAPMRSQRRRHVISFTTLPFDADCV